jgi:hypothetical protein
LLPRREWALALRSRTVIVGLRFDQPYWYHSKILVPTAADCQPGRDFVDGEIKDAWQLVEDKEEPK